MSLQDLECQAIDLAQREALGARSAAALHGRPMTLNAYLEYFGSMVEHFLRQLQPTRTLW